MGAAVGGGAVAGGAVAGGSVAGGGVAGAGVAGAGLAGAGSGVAGAGVAGAGADAAGAEAAAAPAAGATFPIAVLNAVRCVRKSSRFAVNAAAIGAPALPLVPTAPGSAAFDAPTRPVRSRSIAS